MSRAVFVYGLLAALFLAMFISPFASPWPDGLERVAEDKQFIHLADIRPAISSPVPDYAWPGITSEQMATSIAGLAGTLMLWGLGYGLGYLLRRRSEA